MRWNPNTDDTSLLENFAELTELRVFAWGRVLAGISDDSRLPGRYVLLLRDETDDPQPTTWFVFTTQAELHEAQERILGYGTDAGTAGAPVPTDPTPPPFPATSAAYLEL